MALVMSANVLSCCCLPQLEACFSSGSGRLKVSSANGREPLFRTERVRIRARDIGRTALQFQLQTTWSSSVAEGEDQCGDPSYLSPVFEDEAKGIYCYRTLSGEVTCEGYDEGPHFHPAARSLQRTVLKNAQRVSFLTRATHPLPADVSVYKFVKEGRGETWCEGKDES